MAIEKIIWRDEELAPITVAGRQDFAPRYDIVDRDGGVVAAGAKINLVNEVVVQGTRHNAENMNVLMQKCDALGSFFYRPMGERLKLPLHSFPHPAQATSWSWSALPPCPVDVGTNPVCFAHGGKWHVTLGRIGEYNGLTYNIAVFDPVVKKWDVKTHNSHKSINLGSIEDFEVFGNSLFVTGKDWDGTTAATAWLDSLNLDDLSWTFGNTVTWPAAVRTIGPLALADEGERAVVVARDGVGAIGVAVDRFTPGHGSPAPAGMLPNINGAHPPVPVGVVRFNNLHVITMPIREMLHSANLSNWTVTGTHPDISGGYLLPVGADAHHAVFVATQDGISNFFRMDRDFGVTRHDMSRALNRKAVVRGGSRYFHMLSAHADRWEPTMDWGVFDAANGETIILPPAPEVLTDYGLAATESMVFAARGNRAYIGRYDAISAGVVLGAVFKGLSVSATKDVFLVNDRRTVTVSANAWHEADDDYLVCATPEAAVFGQIVNI